MTRRVRTIFAFVTALAILPTIALAEDQPTAADQRKAEEFDPTGSVTIEATTVQLGVGFSWGEGVLTFQNENHPFKVSGLSLVGIGGSKVDAKGTVFNLEKLEDFNGSWVEVSGAAVLGTQSTGGIAMRNGGVYMTLTGSHAGAQISVGGGGLEIELKGAAASPAQS